MASVPVASSPAARPAAPDRLGDVARTAAVDFYYQSIRIVAANAAWGLAATALLGVAAFVSPLAALLVSPVVAVPFVGVFRLAALISRGEEVVLSDVVDAWRRYAFVAIVSGALMLALVVVLAANLIGGLAVATPIAWAFASLAAWGLVTAWVVALAFWSILVDPARDDVAIPAKARLAVATVLAFPARFGGLGLFLAVVLIASGIAVVALLTIGLGYAALVATRYTLPAADRVEAWAREGGAAAS